MPDKVTVYLTMLEDPIEVDADEVPVLKAQGLLRATPAAVEETGAEPPAEPAAKTTRKGTS